MPEWTDYENLRQIDTRWTPLTDELRAVIEGLVKEAGTWKEVEEATGVRRRYIRRLRQTETYGTAKPLKVVSLFVLDKLLALSERADLIESLPWYTVEELMEMGIWKPPLPHMRNRPSKKAA